MFEWYWYFLYYVLMVHFSSIAYTLYEHRGLYHKQFIFSKPLEYVMRILLWYIRYPFPGSRKFLSSQHRMHHVTAETSEDPNTPYGRTWFQMYDVTPNVPGKTGYMSPENMDKYSPEVRPLDDWLERNITGRYWKYGFYLQLLIIGLLFGPVGFILGCIFQTIHRKYFTITVGNILFHNYWFGYKHPGLVKAPDEARNFGPISFFICGEGLHNNHHGLPACPKFSFKWYEVDFGWMWARIFMSLGLLKMTEGAKLALKLMQQKVRNKEF